MAKVLDTSEESVLIKVSFQEYKKIHNAGFFDSDNLDDYEFVFENPVKASDALKAF